MKKIILAAALCLLSVSLRADSVVEEIIARVNNQIITRSEFLRSKEQLKQEIQQAGAADPDKEFAAKERDTLRDLIDQQLLLEKAKDLEISGDAALIKRLDEMRKQLGLSSLEDLEKAAQQQGVSFEEFKQNLKNSIVTEEVIGREVGQHLQPSHEEMEKFYNEHKSELDRPEQIRLSELLVAVKKADKDAPADPAADDKAIADAEAKARDLLTKINGGLAFDDAAKQFSDGPTAAQGGDLGYFKRGTLAKGLDDLVFGMKAGSITDVVRTKQGFVIMKVTEHTPGGIPAMKDVEQQLQGAIYRQKLQPALRTYLTKLREEAFIDIKTGYVDSGASPNQTKPQITTAQVAGAKELKKRKKKLGVL